ncbi:hypothetical protein, partial [Bartonella raoultii]|uniref:hypothetical protein n=1 Tax=Bartonella raoultii TaxID=1457020 RepID=UPI001ABA59BD
MKKYSKSNLLKAVSLGTAMAALLSSVSPVFAAGVGITGGAFFNSSGMDVPYPRGSHGSIVFAGDDDFCGVDNVEGRGGKQQEKLNNKITAQEQYDRFINNKEFANRRPYGTTTEKETWASDGVTNIRGAYMGTLTGGIQSAMPEAYGIYSFVTGCGAAATGNYSTAFGAGATTKAGGAQAFGVSALASGTASIAMGVGSEASGESTVAIGGLATASGNRSIALGAEAKAEKNYAIAIGLSAEAKASGSIAIGSRRSDRTDPNNPNRQAIAKANNAIAIGSNTYAETEDSIAIGANAQVRVNDGVAIGGGAVSDREKGVHGYDPYLNTSSTDDRIAWKSTTGAFSVGEVGGSSNGNLTRQITGVAAGSEDTDAVNVAQLKAMREVIAGGGAWQISANNTNSTAVNAGNTVDFSVTNSGVGKDNLKIAKNTTEDNKHTIQFTLADKLNLTEVTTGQSSMSDDGFFTQNGDDEGPSMTGHGIDAGNTQIENVLEATDDHQAANWGQVKKYVKNNGGGGWKLGVNNEEATDVNPKDTVKFVAVEKGEGNTKSQNINITKDGDHTVKFDLADNITVSKVIAGQSSMSDDGFFINGANGTRMTIDGFFINGDSGPSMTESGIDAGNTKITNVADGTNDTDAVNYKQLKAMAKANKTSWQLAVNGGDAMSIGPNEMVNLEAVSKNGKQNIKIAKGEEHNVKFALADDINVMSVTAGQSIMDAVGFRFSGDNGPSITVNGIHAGGKTIKGVAAGEEDTDAVNFKQLTEVKGLISKAGVWQLSVDGNNATDVKAGSTVDLVAEVNKYGNKNIILKKDNNEVKFDLNENLKLTSVTTGNSIMNSDGFGFIDGNGPKITVNGIQAGGAKITGVKKGSDNTDAVNFEQLTEVRTLAENGWKLSVDGNNATDVKAGSTVDLVADVNKYGNKNIILKKDNNEVKFDLNDKLKLTSVTSGNTLMDESGFGFVDGGPKIMESGIQAGGKKITGVAKGTDETDAVNYGQLTEIKNEIAGNSLVKWDEKKQLITIGKEKDGAKIDIANKSGDARKISGVKEGGVYQDSTEAVNGSQLWDTNEKVAHIDKRVDVISSTVTDISKEVYGLSQDALLWSETEGAFVARHGSEGEKTKSKITYLMNGDIHEESTDAINGSQINKISKDIANFFGGGTEFNDGVFSGPRYNLSHVGADGKVEQKTFENVGDALTGLDTNVKNVNSRLTYVDNKFDKFSQDALLWDEGKGAFSAGHEKDGRKTDSKITSLLNGDVTEDSTDAINGSQLFKIAQNISKYFGGNTDVINGIEPAFLIDRNSYNNVTDAFTGVNISIHRIDNKIFDLEKNNLVKQEGGVSSVITIGKDTAGTEINIAGFGKVARKISGVREAEKGDEAVNKDQLDKSIEKISQDIETASAAAVLYDKDENGIVNYGSVTLGGDKSNGPVALLNVKDGRIAANSTDAINGSQLYSISNQLAAYFGGGAKYENGQWTAPQFTVVQVNADGTTVEKTHNNVADAFGGINKGMSNINNRIDDVINKVDSDALKWNKDKKAYDATHNGTPSKIINVADGKIEKGSKDAVNGGQLWQTNERVANVENRVTDVEKHVEIIDKRVDNISNTIGDIGNTVNNINVKVDK